MNQYEGRQADLQMRINKHLVKLTGSDIDFYSKLTQNDLVELKTVLSDIHNVLTLQLTIFAVNWLCDFFKIDSPSKSLLLDSVNRTKPNAKGYDIQLMHPYKIIAEVKCISPVNNGSRFGAAQSDSILDDLNKLKKGKRDFDPSDYYKFLFITELGNRTIKAINQLLKPSKGTSPVALKVSRHTIKSHVRVVSKADSPDSLSLENVYVIIANTDTTN